jgi:hypothetical protein
VLKYLLGDYVPSFYLSIKESKYLLAKNKFYGGYCMVQDSRIPKTFVFSLLLGVPFLTAWLGFAAMSAKDGREAVTDWLDPMLAGITLLSILFVEIVLLVIWSHINNERLKKRLVWFLMISQWFYIFGEILSNTITIGEPPQDIGSLFEITSGVIVFLSSIGLILVFLKSQLSKEEKRKSNILLILAIVLYVGMVWWFTHPIDQSQPGTPKYIHGNPLYNFFHR